MKKRPQLERESTSLSPAKHYAVRPSAVKKTKDRFPRPPVIRTPKKKAK